MCILLEVVYVRFLFIFKILILSPVLYLSVVIFGRLLMHSSVIWSRKFFTENGSLEYIDFYNIVTKFTVLKNTCSEQVQTLTHTSECNKEKNISTA